MFPAANVMFHRQENTHGESCRLWVSHIMPLFDWWQNSRPANNDMNQPIKAIEDPVAFEFCMHCNTPIQVLDHTLVENFE